MNRSHKCLFFFVYLFNYVICVSLEQLIFCIKFAWNLVRYKTLYVIVFLFLLLCNTIDHVARVRKKLCSVYFELLLFLLYFSRSR